jgi:hypothetical protein
MTLAPTLTGWRKERERHNARNWRPGRPEHGEVVGGGLWHHCHHTCQAWPQKPLSGRHNPSFCSRNVVQRRAHVAGTGQLPNQRRRRALSGPASCRQPPSHSSLAVVLPARRHGRDYSFSNLGAQCRTFPSEPQFNAIYLPWGSSHFQASCGKFNARRT